MMTWRSSGPVHVAWSLDYDLMAEGKTEDDAIEALRWAAKIASEDDAKRGKNLSSRNPADPVRILEILRARFDNSAASLRRIDLLPPSDEDRAGRAFRSLAGNMSNQGYLTLSLWDDIYTVELRRAVSLTECMSKHRDLTVALERALANLDTGRRT